MILWVKCLNIHDWRVWLFHRWINLDVRETLFASPFRWCGSLLELKGRNVQLKLLLRSLPYDLSNFRNTFILRHPDHICQLKTLSWTWTSLSDDGSWLSSPLLLMWNKGRISRAVKNLSLLGNVLISHNSSNWFLTHLSVSAVTWIVNFLKMAVIIAIRFHRMRHV